MFRPYHGIVGDEFLTEEHDPTGTKRMLRRELDLFCGAAESEATVSEGEEFEITVKVSLTDEYIVSLRTRYRDCFETGELKEMADMAEELAGALQATSEGLEVEDDEDAQGKGRAQHAIIAASVAVACSLRQLFLDEIDDRIVHAEMTGMHEGEGWSDEDEDDEKWDTGTATDADDVISDDFSASAMGDDDEFVSSANDAELDEEILEAAMDAEVNMVKVAQSFDAIQKYLDGQFEVERIEDTTPAYQKALVLLMHHVRDASGGTITLRKLLSMRNDPSVTAILTPLTRNESKCCFVSVFHNVAEAALYEVVAFSDMIDAKESEAGSMNQEIHDVVFEFVSELIERNELE